MTINVYEKIKDLLIFETDDDFYHLQILQRKKENPQIGSNSRVIKTYYINNIDYLEKYYDEIQNLCNVFNARAMINLNRRSYYKIAFKTLQNITSNMANKDFKHISNSYNRACGQGNNEKTKRWIVDIDEHLSLDEIAVYKLIIDSLDPIGSKVLKVLPTKNGIHLITHPFNLQQFKRVYPNIDVHKNNPINLYIP